MAKIKFVEPGGEVREVDASVGASIMETAVRNMMPGIDADCGGACACATCHVYIDEAWVEKVGNPEEMEKSMLDFAENTNERSRLSCQIVMSEALDGVVIHLPEI